MRRLLRFLCFAALLVGTRPARATDHAPPSASADRFGPWLPDFVKLQTGGFSGTFTLGLGYAPLHDLLNVAVLYGYVPPAFGGGVQSLHFTLDVRPLSLRSHELRWLPAYLGVGALCTWGRDYFLTLPKRYSDGYYPPNACHVSVHLGAELQWLRPKGWIRAHGFFAELTTIDTLIIDYFQNPRVAAPIDVVASSLGYRSSF